MPTFNYTAINDEVGTVAGTVSAESPRQARDELRGRGLMVEAIRLKHQPSVKPWQFWKRRGRFESQLSPVIRELATLLSAAIPLSDALVTVTSDLQGSLHDSLTLVSERVAAGSSLAEAMREQPYFYDELTIQMIEVGENAGNLDGVLDQLADFRERYQQFKDRVITALFYPVVVLSMGLGVSIFLMTFVVPMLLDNLLEAGQSIPWPTRILRGMSNTLRSHGILLASITIASFTTFVLLIQTEKGKTAWHRFLLRMPLLGGLMLKQELARMALILSTLMESGIVFVQSLEIATRSVRNRILQQGLETTQEAVQAGHDIGESMQSTNSKFGGIFPPVVVQIFTVGQQTGQLEGMLLRLANDYERQVTRLTTRLITIMEPALIVVLALFVGFILFATMLPILEAGNVLQ